MILLTGDPVTTFDEYLAAGGLQGLAEAARLGPEATINEIANSGLRGRGAQGSRLANLVLGESPDSSTTCRLVTTSVLLNSRPG